jgi:hypothetical protein
MCLPASPPPPPFPLPSPASARTISHRRKIKKATTKGGVRDPPLPLNPQPMSYSSPLRQSTLSLDHPGQSLRSLSFLTATISQRGPTHCGDRGPAQRSEGQQFGCVWSWQSADERARARRREALTVVSARASQVFSSLLCV